MKVKEELLMQLKSLNLEELLMEDGKIRIQELQVEHIQTEQIYSIIYNI